MALIVNPKKMEPRGESSVGAAFLWNFIKQVVKLVSNSWTLQQMMSITFCGSSKFHFTCCYFAWTFMVQNDVCAELDSRKKIDLPKGEGFPVLTLNMTPGMCIQVGFVIAQLLQQSITVQIMWCTNSESPKQTLNRRKHPHLTKIHLYWC